MSSNFPSFTKTSRTTSYPKIDPTRPELSAKDKTIIITGGGEGSIGSDIALSFAKAGAIKIAVIGRTESRLDATKSKIKSTCPNTQVLVVVADVSDPESIGLASHIIRETIGGWDVFVNAAAWIAPPVPMVAAEPDEWWKTFEITVRSQQLFAKHFLSKRKPAATLISLNAGLIHTPVSLIPKLSAYTAAKIASFKLDEFLAVENPDLRVFTVDPGLIETNLYQKVNGALKGGALRNSESVKPQDRSLAADFCVWIASPEGEFLRNRFVWANWDVDEMIKRKDELEKDPLMLTLQLSGL